MCVDIIKYWRGGSVGRVVVHDYSRLGCGMVQIETWLKSNDKML